MEVKSIPSCVGLIWYFWLITGTFGCGVRWPGQKSEEPKITTPDFDSEFQNQTEKNALMMNIQNRMLSVALQFIVDFTIETGGLNFTCPEVNQTGMYADFLDCQKYYVCDAENLTTFKTKRCGTDEGFDNVTMTCVPKGSVELCQLAETVIDFPCNSTGLHAHKDCTKFVLCTKEKVAFVSNCNAGDSFDKSLLICLPSFQVNC